MATATPDEFIASNNDVDLAQANVSSTTSTSITTSTANDDESAKNVDDESAKNVDDVRELKLSWLRRLPFEQVIGIVLKLDEFASEETRASIWPADLKSTLQTINVEDTPTVVANEGEVQVAVPDALGTQDQVQVQPPSTPDVVPAPTAELPTPPPPPGFVPPIGSLPPPPPGVAPPGGYPYNPYAPFPPNPFTHPFSPPPPSSSSSSGAGASTPLFTSAPLIRNSGPSNKQPPAPHPGDDEPSLPSYEVMLHQALTVLNDPEGEVPKNLFAWIAAHYPVQQNFRPSASQALQKAFKRGRFEKTKDGKYRINHAWEGQTTSRRTTRRPANTFRHPMLSFPPIPPPPGHPFAPPPGFPAGFPPIPGLPPPSTDPSSDPQTAEQTAAQTKEQIDAWEAAQSILQELNRQALKRLEGVAEVDSNSPAPVVGPSEANDDAAAASTTTVAPPPPLKTPMSTPAFPMPIIAGTVDLDIRKRTDSTSTSSQPDTVQPLTGRAALQSHLVLLATQLAELAGPSHLLAIPTVPAQ